MLADARARLMDVSPWLGRRVGGYHRWLPTSMFGFVLVENREHSVRWESDEGAVRCEAHSDSWMVSVESPGLTTRCSVESFNDALKQAYGFIVVVSPETDDEPAPPFDESCGSEPFEQPDEQDDTGPAGRG